ncbi:universal stress protein [Streptomyces sp. NPDC088789]|uniref:universal stress protein n=1 Tax=Streptomyces sp. NPDC088789 TaxID=3365899 RepID=UPI00381A997B
MTTSSTGRVVVGVDDSEAGRGALCAAVAHARSTGRELLAVHAYALPVDPVPAAPGAPGLLPWPIGLTDPGAARARQDVERALRERAFGRIRDAFGRAMGGVPPDLHVCLIVSVGPPAEVLVATACHDDDLLVVGRPSVGRARWSCPRHWFRHPVWRRCAADATCPVLAVPPGDPARFAGADPPGAGRDVGPGPSAPAAHPGAGEGPVHWPQRACCCSAPPVVRVLLSGAGHHEVDLFLCGHHFRSSLGPLALADADITFREDRALRSPADRR